jgi:hypothetical protein
LARSLRNGGHQHIPAPRDLDQLIQR